MKVLFSLDTKRNKVPLSIYNRYIDVLKYHGLTATLGKGQYQGTEETCIMVELASDYVPSIVTNIAKEYNQESLLFIDSDNKGFFIYLDTMRPVDSMSYWTQVMSKPVQDHTVIDNKFYILK